MGIEPLYPFGYGLSYTTFSVSFSGIRRIKEGVEITVFCENTGERYSGREVVQVYVTPPQTEMEKEEKRLYTILRDSDGKDRVTIYIENPKSMKKLPPNMGVRADTVLLQELGTVFGEDNVKVV